MSLFGLNSTILSVTTRQICSHLEHAARFTLSTDPQLAVACSSNTLWLCMCMRATERESVGSAESVRQTSFYHWGVERSVNCGISTGESITHLEVRWWERQVQWEHFFGLLWIMSEKVNSARQIHAMSEAGLLYMCLRTVLGVRALWMSHWAGTSGMTST